MNWMSLVNKRLKFKTSRESPIVAHSKFRIITYVAIKVHVILRSFLVLTWIRDTVELV